MISTTTRIRADRLNKKGETRILAVIFEGKKTKELSTGISVAPANWDQQKQRVSKKDSAYQVKNSKLALFLSDLEKSVNKQQINNEKITLSEISPQSKSANVSDQLLVDYLDQYITENPDALKSGTLMYYKTCLERIKAFNSKIKLTEIDEKYLNAFEKHLKKKYNNSQNTIFNRLKVIRKILLVAKRKKLITTNPFEHFKIKTEETKRDFLSYEELKKIIALQNLVPMYELVKDMYIFSAFSGGLRFGDIATLSTEHLTIIDDEYRINLKTTKTIKRVGFKLPLQSITIIEKYKGKGIVSYLFPILSSVVTEANHRQLVSSKNASFNRILKFLAKKADIPKHLTFHTARHTWATISLANGVQTEVVGNIMGHRDLKTTQIYTKILDESKDHAIDIWNDLE